MVRGFSARDVGDERVLLGRQAPAMSRSPIVISPSPSSADVSPATTIAASAAAIAAWSAGESGRTGDVRHRDAARRCARMPSSGVTTDVGDDAAAAVVAEVRLRRRGSPTTTIECDGRAIERQRRRARSGAGRCPRARRPARRRGARASRPGSDRHAADRVSRRKQSWARRMRRTASSIVARGHRAGRHRRRSAACRRSSPDGISMSSPGAHRGHGAARTARIQSDSTKPVKPQSPLQDVAQQVHVLGAVLAVHRVVRRHDRADVGIPHGLAEVRQVDLAQRALVHPSRRRRSACPRCCWPRSASRSAMTCCCTPRTNAAPMRPRCTVSSPYVSWARPQRGWRRMLMVGASSTLPAFARTSAPIASPTCSSRSGSHVAPRAEPTGNAVAWPAYWPTPRGPSTIANPGMPSRSSGAVRHVPSTSCEVPCICCSFSSMRHLRRGAGRCAARRRRRCRRRCRRPGTPRPRRRRSRIWQHRADSA